MATARCLAIGVGGLTIVLMMPMIESTVSGYPS